MKTLRLLTFVVATCATAAFADDAPATETSSSGGSGIHAQGALLDASPQESRSMILSVHGTLPYGHIGLGYFPIGGGASFYIPLVKNGFISKLNDEFGIDFGADVVAYLGYTYPLSIYVPVGVQWKFHILENLEVYAKLAFLARIWFGNPIPFWPDVNAAVGAHYMFSKGFGVKAEIGYPGVRIGVVFAF